METVNKIEDQTISHTRAYQQFLREHLFKENARQGSLNQSQKVEKPPQEIVKNNAPKVMENVVPEAKKMISQKAETVETIFFSVWSHPSAWCRRTGGRTAVPDR